MNADHLKKKPKTHNVENKKTKQGHSLLPEAEGLDQYTRS